MVTIARSVVHQYRTLTTQVEQFEATVSAVATRTHPSQLAGFDTPALLDAFAEFMDIRTNRWVGAGLADGACMVCCGALEAFLDRHFDEPGPVLLSGLLRGLPDIVSSEPPRHLWRLSRLIRADADLHKTFRQDTPSVLNALGWDGRQMTGSHAFATELQTWLEDWGFRCTGELMFRVDSFQEEPGAVIDMLRSYAGMDGDGPDEVIARQGQARLDQTEQLASRLSAPRRVVFRQLLRATGGSLSLRERARLKQALLYRRCRRVVLTLGERLQDAGQIENTDDVLYMHWQELLALRDGYCPPRHTIAARRRAFDGESQWPPPPARIVLPRNEGWQPPKNPVIEPLPEGDELTGLAAAGGVVTARATVARGQADFHLVNAGDVLVAPQTDPGWATVLFLVKGLVMERGGMLSHGAIIAREFGIPSVVAVDRATERIPQHGQVTVDGDRGHVRIGR
jgi:pyruvate,water dikinase